MYTTNENVYNNMMDKYIGTFSVFLVIDINTLTFEIQHMEE